MNNTKIIRFHSTTIAEHETKRCYRRYGRDEYKFRRLLLLFSSSTSIFSPLPAHRTSLETMFIYRRGADGVRSSVN